jgi:trehalose 6-phosphate synthase/phosphatase
VATKTELPNRDGDEDLWRYRNQYINWMATALFLPHPPTMPPVMDSFAEPYTRQGDDISIEQARQKIVLLEQQHRDAGIPLSGRIIHVCHYLPITATLRSKNLDIGVLSPPATPPMNFSDADLLDGTKRPTSSSAPVWSLSQRHGHSAMTSGIRSLSQSHEQLIVGWTGDIMSLSDTVPVDSISADDKAAFQDALNGYEPDSDDEQDREAKYVPVWLDDKVAHGHYDGYCKQSEHLPPILSMSFNS